MHFFPKADSALLSSTVDHNSLPPRPKAIGPIFDANNFKKPVEPWADGVQSDLYPPKEDPYAPSAIPVEPSCPSVRYPRSRLAKNERLRLSMLWYYASDLEEEPELLAGLQEKACLAQENSGWEFAVVGLLDVNVYIRLATVGLQLAILPRGETLCAHTVTQPPGNVFLLPNMLEDWRFRESPYVEQGGLIAYAGVPLRMQHESGESVGLGSLCVASATSQPPLSKQQQLALARLGDWIVADIVQCARARRQRERHRFSQLIATLQREPEGEDVQEPILRILRQAYPNESVTLQFTGTDSADTTVPYPATASDLKHGLWEDDEYIEDFIAASNCNEPPNDRVIRFISAQCESKIGPSVLVVATKNFRRIFDDVDSWFVHTCATLLTQRWQKRLLVEVMRAKEKFLRGVSHQLRTPIHGILGAAELLTEDLRALTVPGSTKLRPGVEELMRPLAELSKSSVYLDTISTAGRELMSTVNSMITLNRWADIAAADRQFATHTIEELENSLVKGSSDVTLRDARTRAPLFFHHDLNPSCQSLRIDLDLFRDSALPLIVNAIQNTTEGIITVTLSYTQDTKTLVVDVEDTGCGIHPDHQSRIFELYEKVGEHSTGAGLGLTLATKFSALLRGSIELVSSEVDRGSHFRATFGDEGYGSNTTSSNNGSPVPQAEIEELHPVPRVLEADKTSPHDLPIRTLSDTSKPMTLLVDDNAVNLRILEMYCKKRGLPYRSTIDGRQAVDLFTQRQQSSSSTDPPFDLILMDLQMPVCDGISATQEIRSLEKTGDKKSVLFIVTGQDSQTDREAASAAGADNYLVKPVGIKLLDASLRRYFPGLIA
ncbi:hypothetical protein ACLX1H_004987 [Fusarium chlamydosporum]